jgi:hypothetical protein
MSGRQSTRKITGIFGTLGRLWQKVSLPSKSSVGVEKTTELSSVELPGPGSEDAYLNSCKATGAVYEAGYYDRGNYPHL